MAEPFAVAIFICASFGYGFFLGRWSGIREGRRDRKLAVQLLRRSQIALRGRNGNVVTAQFDREK